MARRFWRPVAAWMLLALVGAQALLRAQQTAAPAAEAAQLRADGLAAKRAGNYALATEKLRRAVELAPKDVEAWWVLAWTLDVRAQLKEALPAFQQVLALLPAADPRRPDTQRMVDRLERALRPRLAVAPPPEPDWRVWLPTGPALGLLAALVGLCVGAALVAWRDDLRQGPDGPAGRFVALCAAVGQPSAARQILALAATSEAPPGDLAPALALAARHHASVRETLAAWLQGTGQQRRLAALALATGTDQPRPEAWLGLLAADEPELARCALEALTRHPLPAACSAVRRWLHGPHEALGVAAARALGALGDELSAGALVEAARDARDGRRAAALAELDRRASLPAAVIAPLEEMLATAPDAASLVPLLAAVGPAAAGALVGCLLAPDEGVRQTAARHLTVDGAHGLVPLPASGRQALAALAKAAGPPVTAELLLVVATCEPAVGDVFLAAALRADDWLLRNAAVDHLAARGGAEAVEPLRRALVALPCELDEPGRHHLQRLCDALRGCRAVDALAQLIARHALAPGQPGPWHAACALAESGLAGEALAAATSHRQREVRVGAVALLAEYPYPEAAEALLAELARQDGAAADGAHLADLARALGRMREPRAREPLAALRPNAGNGLADALDVALARLGDAAAKARVDAMLVREAWPDRRPAADYFRDLPDIPPRAAAIVQEADAHHRAQAILADGGRRASERLAALGASVGPSLREWLLAGWHRREVARALVQLGQTEALRVAGILDRLDELLPRLGEAEGVRAELEQIASAGPDLVRQYLREHGWEA